MQSHIDSRIKAFADWYTANDPNIQAWLLQHQSSAGPGAGPGLPGQPFAGPGMSPGLTDLSFWDEIVKRQNDWHWFAEMARDFVQRNLRSEGP